MIRMASVLLVMLAGCAPDGDADVDDPTSDTDPGVGATQGTSPARALSVEMLPVHRPLDTDADTGGPDAPASVPLTCRILEPADGDTVAAHTPIHFEGEVVDVDGVVQTVTWRSSVWGAMVLGTSFDFELPAADHLISMTARDDGDRACAASITLHVE
jgi:hypothetical protein